MEERKKILDDLLSQVIQMTDEDVAKYLEHIKQQHETNLNSSESDEPLPSYSLYSPPAEEENQSTAFYIENNLTYSWKRSPQTFLVSCKPNDDLSEQLMGHIINELKRCHITVLVAECYTQKYNCVAFQKDQLNAQDIDLVIVIGGDGSLLYVSSLFNYTCPPIVSFNSGSLGFLAPYPHNFISQAIQQILNGPLVVSHRHRLHAYLVAPKRRPKSIIKQQDLEPNSNSTPMNQLQHGVSAIPRSMKQYDTKNNGFCLQNSQNKGQCPKYTAPLMKFQPPLSARVYTALNEVYIHRGGGPALTNLQCYADGYYFGTIQADGLLVSTPTGSTAYALSAGGVPVAPEVNCILFTPVCPHVMSSKQLILPDVVLKIKASLKSRGTVYVCFDGRDNLELEPGHSIVIARAQYDLPTVSFANSSVDWFFALKRCLNWNVRIEQKQFKRPGGEAIDERVREVGDPDSDLE